jgi:hypothetical protein
MNNEFHEKLQLYKEGKLSQNEASEIECEIDKFSAITDYLNDDDKAFLEELKQQIPQGNSEENKPAKLLKSRVNFKIIKMTAISVCFISLIIISLFFLTSNIVKSLFNLDNKEAFVEKSKIVQLAQMIHPQYDSHGSGVEGSHFAPQQNISVSLDNTVGNTIIDKTEINVRYSFGKPVRPVRSETSVLLPLLQMKSFSLLGTEDLPLIDADKSITTFDFKPLEKAPEGTNAKIFVVFSKALTPEQLKEYIINQISTAEPTPLKFTPLAAMDSDYILANPSYYRFTPFYPFNKSNNNYAKYFESNNLKQIQFDNMDDNAHKESFISNLNLIKSNKKLVQIMYYEDIFDYMNIDNVIKYIENNGVKYIGMYISADSKELLKLKDNPMIDHILVENIVVW